MSKIKEGLRFSPKLAFILLCLINLCWGGSYAATKIALTSVPPTTLAMLRFLIGGFFLLFIPHSRAHKLKKKDWKDLAIIGAFGVAISYALLNLGLQLTSSTKTAIAVSGAGLLMLGNKNLSTLYNEIFSAGEFLGDILVIFAILLAALYSVLIKPVTQRVGALKATSYGFFLGAFFLLPISYLELSQLWPISFTKESLLAIIFLGVVCNAIAFTLWNQILKYTDAGVMAVTLNAQPIGGIAIGVLLLGETLSLNGIIGTALILTGIWLLPIETVK
jgi:drug/metabolite transporter (DMT)-like permease